MTIVPFLLRNPVFVMYKADKGIFEPPKCWTSKCLAFGLSDSSSMSSMAPLPTSGSTSALVPEKIKE